MPLTIVNANIVTPDEVLANASLVIEDGRIAKIGAVSPEGEVLDAKGAFLLPGFVAVRSDNIEQMVEPRPGSLIDTSIAIKDLPILKTVLRDGVVVSTLYQDGMGR